MAVAEIAPQEAERRLGELQTVDVRAAHEFHGPLGRVRGAILVPLPELEARARELPSGRPLLLVCRSGARSGRACEKLAALGIGPALNLAGGMIAWNRAQLPVERTEPGSLAELVASASAWLAQVGGLAPEAVGLPLAQPTRERAEALLARIEQGFRGGSAPPDLDLTLASLRRSLARL
jgi:rhodanese-related sulfurtransferase